MRTGPDGVLLAALAGVLYVALGQDAFHGVDSHEFMQRLGIGPATHRYHFLYLPLANGLCQMLAWFGVSTYAGALAASALGTAVGVLLLHRAACILGLDRGQAMLVGVLCATAPAVVFFSTVVEVHGVFYAFVGLGWWGAAHLMRQPGWPRAALLGLGTGVAASAHATGHLFFGLVVLVWMAGAPTRAELGWRRIVAMVLTAGAVHAVVVLLFAAWLQQPGLGKPLETQLEMLTTSLTRGATAERWAEIIWNEWLWGYFPLSFVALWALRYRAERARAVAVLLALLVYIAVVSALLIYYRTDERGAYYMPFAFPCSLLAVAILPRGLAWGAALVALAIGVSEVVVHDRPGRPDAFAHDLLQATGDRTPVLLYGDTEEARAVMRVDASVPVFNVVEIVDIIRHGQQPADQAYRDFCAFFDTQVANAERDGRVYTITDSTHELMSNPAFPVFARWLREYLPGRYTLQRVERGEFAGYTLRPE